MDNHYLDNLNKNDPNEITIFAETNFRNQKRRFGIKKDDRRRHMYLIGKTGMGKSVTLEHMIYSDIQAGNGLALVDPHGDLADKILDFIPSNRINDVVYFNPADIDYPIAFNILESVSKDKQHLIASGLIGVFKKIWSDSWGPRLEYLLRNVILALLDYKGSTLLGVMRILVDKEYRKLVIQAIQDPVVKTFWTDEYSRYPEKFQVEAIAPIQNKVGQFLSNSLIRNIVGQVKSSINMREIMDNRKILILNLSKGHIGEDTAALIGAMMITKIQLTAMERIDIAERDRADFYLYVDEFQNFATDSFASILSEARKYRLCLIMAHQYIAQLNEVVQPAVFGNVGTIICFRVGAIDAADALSTEFAPRFAEEDLVNLSKYQIYLKLMIDGVASEAFSASTLPPITINTNNREKIIKVSRERYANSRAIIEEKISKWTEKQGQTKAQEIQTGSMVKPFNRQFLSSDSSKDRSSFSKPRVDQAAKREIPPISYRAATVQSRYTKQEVKPVVSEQLPLNTQNSTINKNIPSINKTIWYPTICSQCGIKTEVPFPLDGKKIPYCKKCLRNVYAQKPDRGISTRKSNPTVTVFDTATKDSHLTSSIPENKVIGNNQLDTETKDNIHKEEESNSIKPVKLAPGEVITLKP